MPTHLDLFSGIGGFAIAAQACGYTTIGFCEKEPYAQQILKERFGAVLADAEKLQRDGCEHHAGSNSEKRGQVSKSGNGCRPRLHPDIFTLNGADYAGVDLLTGGFPCQPFSVAGKRRGKDDDRAIWPEMLRVINEAHPAWIIGENVAGIVTMELDNILSDLEALNYAAWPLVIPACAVDARHRRDRVWIVAHASGGVRQREAQREAGHAAQRDQDVADAECVRLRTRRNDAGQSQISELIHQSSSSEDVAHADGERGCLREVIRADAGDAGESSRPRQRQDGGQLESTVLRMVDGLPERLDSGGSFCQWPDEDRETPRVTAGIKHRAHRLRGLGNSIVVQVATEIIRAMNLSGANLGGGSEGAPDRGLATRCAGTGPLP